MKFWPATGLFDPTLGQIRSRTSLASLVATFAESLYNSRTTSVQSFSSKLFKEQKLWLANH